MPRPVRASIARWLIAAAMLGACWAACPLTAVAAPGQAVTSYTLPNGLKVILKEVHSAPVASVFVFYKVGSRNEPIGLTGMAHILEHMMFKGTKTIKPGEFDAIMRRIGADWNAYTTADYTAYYESLPAVSLATALQVESERMTGSAIDPIELKHEMVVVMSELEGDANNPQDTLYKHVKAAAFLAHPYRWPVIGWTSDVRRDTRADVYAFYKKYYAPNNATLVVVGDFNSTDVAKIIQADFGPLAKGPAPPGLSTEEPPQMGERRTIVRQEGTTAYLQVAYHIPAVKSDDMYALAVFDAVMTGGRSSRLYKALVDGRLAADVGGYLDVHLDPGLYQFFITPLPGVSIAKIEPVLYQEIDRMKTEPISDWELQKAINQVKAAFIYGNDSIQSQAEELGYYETLTGWRYMNSYVDHVKQVTKEDVMRVAKEYFGADNRTVGIFDPLPVTGTHPVGGGMSPVRRAPLPEAADPPSGTPQWLDGTLRAYYGGATLTPAAGATPVKAKPARVPARKAATKPASKSPAASATAMTTPRSPVKATRTVLPNGLVVIVQENHANSTVSFELVERTGSLYESPDKSGLASMTARLLDRGTATRSADDIAKALDFIGAGIGANASVTTLSLRGRCVAEDFSTVLDLLGDMAQHPAFPEGQLAKAKDEVKSALQQEAESPDDQAYHHFRELLFPATNPLHFNELGTPASVDAITREDLAAFYRTYARPDTAILVVVGDVKTEDVVSAAGKVFGGWVASGPPPPYALPAAENPAAAVTKIISMPEKTQVQVTLGNVGLARSNPDYYACTVMNYILGGDTIGSRLGHRIRDKEGLVYGVYSRFYPLNNGPGYWSVGFGANAKNVDRALQIVTEEVHRIKQAPVTDQELAEAKHFLITRLIMTLETNNGILSMLTTEEMNGLGLDYTTRYASIINGVTKAQVQAVAGKYLHPDRFVTVIAGPYQAAAQGAAPAP